MEKLVEIGNKLWVKPSSVREVYQDDEGDTIVVTKDSFHTIPNSWADISDIIFILNKI